MKTRSRIGFLFCTIVGCVVLTACAKSAYVRYSDVMVDIEVSGDKTVAVAVHDVRQVVVRGTKGGGYVGTIRGAFGGAEDLLVESEKPLSEVITQTIASSLEKSRFTAIPVAVSASDSEESVLGKLQDTGADLLFLLTLYQWESETVINTYLHYNLVLNVYDQTGNVLVTTTMEGKDSLKGNPVHPIRHAVAAIPPAFQQKVEELFNNPSVIKVLVR